MNLSEELKKNSTRALHAKINIINTDSVLKMLYFIYLFVCFWVKKIKPY